MRRRESLPKPEDCIKGRVYKLHSRNLSYGVWNGHEGFIGIRTKWYDRYLFTEYHYDVSEMYGTVADAIDTGIDVPPHIPIRERLETIDRETMREVYFDEPIADGGRGWCFKDNDEASEDIRPVSVHNKLLIQFLDQTIKELSNTDDDV